MKQLLFSLLFMSIGCAKQPEVVNPTVPQQDIDNDACLFEAAVDFCKYVEFGVKRLKIRNHKEVWVKCADFNSPVILECK